MRANRHARAGFTLVELTVVVVISTIVLISIYQTLITQERTYRYQNAAIDAQGSSRTAMAVLTSELREISASAGSTPTAMSGSDLLVATADSIRFRSFRKVGIVCAFSRGAGTIDVWVPGTPFVAGDQLMIFQEGDTLTDEDDRWDVTPLTAAGTATNAAGCAAEWNTYPLQGLVVAATATDSIERGGLVRGFETVTYGSYQHDGDWVLGRRNPDDELVPLVGPILPRADGGLRFRYFNVNGTQITPSTEALRGQVSRIEITVRALSEGGVEGPYVDSLTSNVYLRGN